MLSFFSSLGGRPLQYKQLSEHERAKFPEMFGAMLKVMKDVDQYKELLYAFNGSLDPRRIVQAVSLLLLRDVSEAKLVRD